MRLGSVLLPGCLLPAPFLLAQAAVARATLTISVDAAGEVSAASMAESTGSAAVDAALPGAVLKCKFSPAFEIDASAPARKVVAEQRTLDLAWLPSAPAYSPHRCISPEYPHAARRAEETGRIVVLFRRDVAAGKIVSQLQADSPPLRTLRALTLNAVAACMAHDEVSTAVPADKVFSVMYDWRLQ
ncbi:MAG: hypothetical protein CFE46_14510 [Burkholderiales bacterium PBB6]|nr:MAG: hypothetical protein CFE46_14510 [Burkholderiales bacterium PBB6]